MSAVAALSCSTGLDLASRQAVASRSPPARRRRGRGIFMENREEKLGLGFPAKVPLLQWQRKPAAIQGNETRSVRAVASPAPAEINGRLTVRHHRSLCGAGPDAPCSHAPSYLCRLGIPVAFAVRFRWLRPN